ncbi:MAG TPA: HD domain-containing phosphohydrolase [Burkholderiales bacterium]|nr:HD domain-containing phosphohydrolase [Burkholderiales bacterium]
MVKQRIAAQDLRLGMYVVELDRPWLGTSFAFQGFQVNSPEEIESLRSYCTNVYVDPERDRNSGREPRSAPLRGTAVYDNQQPLEKEFAAARDIYARCQDTLHELIRHLRSDGDIDATLLSEAVRSMSDSIARNPDALLLLNRLVAKDSHEIVRAMDTSILMVTFGRFLQYPKERLEALGLAGMLLDIGKVRMEPLDYVQRPLYVREPDERIRAHVQASVDLIAAASGLPQGVAQIVAQHHERQDGEGYPSGLKAEEISVDGAIAALVDSYVELTCGGPNRDQATPSNALSMLHKLRGTLFHEALVEQFIQCIGIYPVGSAVELSSGEIGLVIAQNLVRRLQPRVMVVLDSDRALLKPHRILDLIRDPLTADGDPYRIRRTLPKDTLPIDVKEFFI